MKNQLFSLILLSLSSPAFAADCGDRVRAFNIYEELENGSVVERMSFFPVEEWSPHSTFEGLAVKAAEGKDLRLEIEIRERAKGPAKRTQSFDLRAWEFDPSYLVAEGFEEFFGEENDGYFFVYRLLKGKNAVCESAPLEIFGGD